MNLLKHSLRTCISDNRIPKSMEKPPNMGEYKGNGYPDENVQLVNKRLKYLNADKSSKCKMFMLTLIGSIRLWFNALPNGSIKSWTHFYERFTAHCTVHKRKPVTITSLNGINQGKKECVHSYNDRLCKWPWK